MWNKIYSIAASAFFVLMAVLTYLAYSWLQSVDKPVNVVASYDYYSGIASMFLWLSSIILLVLANVVLWKTSKSWALWSTFLYFAIFILARTFWLDQSFFNFKQQNNLAGGSFSVSAFLGLILCVLAAAIVFFNQFLVTRFRNKMIAAEQPVESFAQEPIVQQLPPERVPEEKEVL